MSRFFVAFFIALIIFNTPQLALANCKALFKENLKDAQRRFAQAELEEQFLFLIDQFNEMPALLESNDQEGAYRKLKSILNHKAHVLNGIFREYFQYSVMDDVGPIPKEELANMLKGLGLNPADLDKAFASFKQQRELLQTQEEATVETKRRIGFGGGDVVIDLSNEKKFMIGFGERQASDLNDADKLTVGFGVQKKRRDIPLPRQPGALEFVFESQDSKVVTVKIIDKEKNKMRSINLEILSMSTLVTQGDIIQVTFNPETHEFVVARLNHLNPNGQFGFQLPTQSF